MHKLFDAGVDPVVLVAANEEFPSAQASAAEQPENHQVGVRGWSAYEIWHSRIRLRPGVTGLFLPVR
jgi:hypothetical protein